MNDIDVKVFKILLESGNMGVVKSWQYYGGHYKFDKKKTEALKAIADRDIDWEKSSMYDDSEGTFIDTFANADQYESVIAGTIVTKDGEKFQIGSKISPLELALLMTSNLLVEPTVQKERAERKIKKTVKKTVKLT